LRQLYVKDLTTWTFHVFYSQGLKISAINSVRMCRFNHLRGRVKIPTHHTSSFLPIFSSRGLHFCTHVCVVYFLLFAFNKCPNLQAEFLLSYKYKNHLCLKRNFYYLLKLFSTYFLCTFSCCVTWVRKTS
jgi:hypothetical protein